MSGGAPDPRPGLRVVLARGNIQWSSLVVDVRGWPSRDVGWQTRVLEMDESEMWAHWVPLADWPRPYVRTLGPDEPVIGPGPYRGAPLAAAVEHALAYRPAVRDEIDPEHLRRLVAQ